MPAAKIQPAQSAKGNQKGEVCATATKNLEGYSKAIRAGKKEEEITSKGRGAASLEQKLRACRKRKERSMKS